MIQNINEKKSVLWDSNINKIIDNIINIIKTSEYKNIPGSLVMNSVKQYWFDSNFIIRLYYSETPEAIINLDEAKFNFASDNSICYITNFVIVIYAPYDNLTKKNLDLIKESLRHEFLHAYEIYNKARFKNITGIDYKTTNPYVYNKIIKIKNDSSYNKLVRQFADMLYLFVPEETQALLSGHYEDIISDEISDNEYTLITYYNISKLMPTKLNELSDDEILKLVNIFDDCVNELFNIKFNDNIDRWKNKLINEIDIKLNKLNKRIKRVTEFANSIKQTSINESFRNSYFKNYYYMKINRRPICNKVKN